MPRQECFKHSDFNLGICFGISAWDFVLCSRPFNFSVAPPASRFTVSSARSAFSARATQASKRRFALRTPRGERCLARGELPFARRENPFARGENPFARRENPLARGENPSKTGEFPAARGTLPRVRCKLPHGRRRRALAAPLQPDREMSSARETRNRESAKRRKRGSPLFSRFRYFALSRLS